MENEIDGLELTNEEVTTAFSDFEAKDLTALIRLKKALVAPQRIWNLSPAEGDDKLRLDEYLERATLAERAESTLNRIRKRRERQAKREPEKPSVKLKRKPPLKLRPPLPPLLKLPRCRGRCSGR